MNSRTDIRMDPDTPLGVGIHAGDRLGPKFGQSDLFHSGTRNLFNPKVPENDVVDEVLKGIKFGSKDDSFKKTSEITSRIIQPTSQFTRKNGSMTKEAISYIRRHGFGDEFSAEDRENYDKILDLPIMHSMALISYFSGKAGVFDLEETYFAGVRAMNTLSLLIDKLREHKRPFPPKDEPPFPDSEEWRWAELLLPYLRRVWDVGIWLLGTIRTRARVLAQNHTPLAEANVIHATHYRAAVRGALRINQPIGKVCTRALYVMTRECVPPFVPPLLFIKRLNALGLEAFHIGCTRDECKRDTDGKEPKRYHVPPCDGSCKYRKPPDDSLFEFNQILENLGRMPAVKVDPASDQDWWAITSKDTLAISHVWRDGIYGTRDEPGLSNCLHEYFCALAKKNSLSSYWIDCATIPTDEKQRELMIQMINYTFRESRFTLCFDNRIARVPSFESPGTALLAIMASFWHRRAWTLLEGHKASDVRFMRENDQLNPFNMFKAILSVLGDQSDGTSVPIWLLSSIAELEAYVISGLTAESSGMLLSSRRASRDGDAELIWRLLVQPFTTQVASNVLNATAFEYSTTIDSAFISSNAARSQERGLCWMPAKTNASEWISYAVGAQMVDKIEVKTTYLRGEYFRKDAGDFLGTIDWNSTIVDETVDLTALKKKVESPAHQSILVCPVWRVGPRQGKWNRAIIMTRPRLVPHGKIPDLDRHELLWHWETIIELSSEVHFQRSDIATLSFGYEDDNHPSPAGWCPMATCRRCTTTT